MTENSRVSSIDAMRGLTIILMLFLNDLNLPLQPSMLSGNPMDLNTMGLAGWLLPCFLFIVGMAIPYSIGKRVSEDQNTFSIAKHIFKRTICLLIIGLLMLNSERVNPEFTGIGKYLWAILMYIAVFLIWNKYAENEKNFFTLAGLRLAGVAILVFLIFKFRSGEFENNGSLITSWWGTLGIIGWGYLVSAFIYLLVRDSILNIVIAFLFFLAINILSKLDLLNYLNPFKSVFGVIIEGNVPFIVLSGVLTTLILKKYSKSDFRKTLLIIVSAGSLSLLTGFILKYWLIISKTDATTSRGLISIGVSMMFFALLHWIIDIKKHTSWTSLFRPAGEYALTTFLISYFLYSIILSTGLPILIYKQSGVQLIVIAGSVIWAFLMVALTGILIRYNIRLKL